MSGRTITLSDALAARVAEGAGQAGRPVDAFVEVILDTYLRDLTWEGARPALRVPADAAPVSVEQIDQLLQLGDAD
jgi:hypothetical protein